MCFNFELCSQSINIVTNTHHCRSTKLKEIRARASNPNTLLLDGGDQFQGTFWFYVYKGMAAAQFMKKLGYDAMVCEIPLDIIVILFYQLLKQTHESPCHRSIARQLLILLLI